MTLKAVLPLQNVHETSPWTWHGWQENLTDAMHKSITSTMLGKAPSDHDKQAMIAYLQTLQEPPNPFRGPNGELSAAAKRGEVVFNSSKAACADCHHGPYFTTARFTTSGWDPKRITTMGTTLRRCAACIEKSAGSTTVAQDRWNGWSTTSTVLTKSPAVVP